MADITFRDLLATSIYGHIQEELDSMPEMHPTVINAHVKLLTKSSINLSNSNIIYLCVVFFFIWIVGINRICINKVKHNIIVYPPMVLCTMVLYLAIVDWRLRGLSIFAVWFTQAKKSTCNLIPLELKDNYFQSILWH